MVSKCIKAIKELYFPVTMGIGTIAGGNIGAISVMNGYNPEEDWVLVVMGACAGMVAGPLWPLWLPAVVTIPLIGRRQRNFVWSK